MISPEELKKVIAFRAYLKTLRDLHDISKESDRIDNVLFTLKILVNMEYDKVE